MPALLSNGATILLFVLLVLVIAYRFYSAFIAAKVLAFDNHRSAGAPVQPAGRPADKWLLFGRHLAVAGAGPLIGPVLAAQFGYLPGLLWILIGVCLAGAVQDFIILALSIRHEGRSLARIAASEIGPVAATAAAIGMLLALIIALAALGKVVTSTLGSHAITFPAGTQFVGSDYAFFSLQQQYDRTLVYRIPPGAEIRFPSGSVPVTSTLRIEVTPKNNGAPIDIDDTPRYLAASRTRPTTSPATTRPATDAQRGPAPSGLHMTVTDDVHVVATVEGSPRGAFTVFLSIPIALFVGFYLHRLRKGRPLEAALLGGLLILLAVHLGERFTSDGSFFSIYADMFNLSQGDIGTALLLYGFVASLLPAWLLSTPRDCIAGLLKIAALALLTILLFVAHPQLRAPAIHSAFLAGGPVVDGPIIPFLFITITGGAISGLHALFASVTAVDLRRPGADARAMGYRAMLLEGFVAILALVAAAALPPADYFHITSSPADRAHHAVYIPQTPSPGKTPGLAAPADVPLPDIGENLQGRPGGAVTFATAVACIVDTAARNVIGYRNTPPAWLLEAFRYCYHFAILLVVLFVLAAIDTGTRVGRLLLRHIIGGRSHSEPAPTESWPFTILATTIISLAWWSLLSTSTFANLWSLFGLANLLLAVIALAVTAAALARRAKRRYLAVSLIPMIVLALIAAGAAVVLLIRYYAAITRPGPSESPLNLYVSSAGVLILLVCTAIVLIGALRSIITPAAPIAPDLAPQTAATRPNNDIP